MNEKTIQNQIDQNVQPTFSTIELKKKNMEITKIDTILHACDPEYVTCIGEGCNARFIPEGTNYKCPECWIKDYGMCIEWAKQSIIDAMKIPKEVFEAQEKLEQENKK